MAQIKHIGLYTSGGDAPGMNAAIRAVVRSALYYNIEVTGILRGYHGMIRGEFQPMGRKSVSNIVQRGGTILKTARSDSFKTPEGRKLAYEKIKERNKLKRMYFIISSFSNRFFPPVLLILNITHTNN